MAAAAPQGDAADAESWHGLALALLKRRDFWGDSLATLGYVAVGNASLAWNLITESNGPGAMLTAEAAQVPLMGQVAGVGLLSLCNPRLRDSKAGKVLLLFNMFGLYVHAKRLSAAMAAGAAFREGLARAGVRDRSGRSAADWSLPAALALLFPLRSFLSGDSKKRFKRVGATYGSLELVDPELFAANQQLTKQEKMIQTYVGRGRTAQWLSMDVLCDPALLPAGSGDAGGPPRPVLMYIHGGGWTVGDKMFACKSSLEYLAANEQIVVCSINYRLAPNAAWPAQLLDCKRALVYLKANVHKWGGDPTKITVAGESAGGHLTAMMALTANDPAYDPEEFTGAEDTSVRAAVDIYGVHDLLDSEDHHLNNETEIGLTPWKSNRAALVGLIEKVVLQRRVRDDAAHFEDASPTHILEKKLQEMAKEFYEHPADHPELCPMMVVHGTKDQLAAYDDSMAFFQRIRRIRKATKSTVQDAFITVPGGRHAFGYFPSPRAVSLALGMSAFIHHHTADNVHASQSAL